MFKKRLYTFIVASHAGGKVWRLSLPYSILVTVGVLVLVGSLALGGAAFQYGKMILKVVDYEHRILENDQLRIENHEYKVQTAQLGEKIDILETLSHKLQVFTGYYLDKAVGGVGGVSPDALNRSRSASAGALQSVTSYDKKISALSSKLRDLDNKITDGILVAAAAPSLQPVNGYITAGWGTRSDPFDSTISERHQGVDISAPLGTPIIAPADGTVIFAGPHAGYGNIIVIDHKFGMTTRYAHLQNMDVKVGQHVSRGNVIGYVGRSGRTTGPHLHYEVWLNGRDLNPAKFFQISSAIRVVRP